METKTYRTALGDFSFAKQHFSNYPGLVGQWQNGMWEVIDVGAKRTAKPMFPKPEWAPPPPAKK